MSIWGDVGLKEVRLIGLVTVLLLSLFVGFSGCVRGVEGDSMVEDAEQALGDAYEEVLEAEEAGATVSPLLDKLNKAGEHLAVARVCLRTDDSECAVGNASLCLEWLDGVVEEAQSLRDEAKVESTWHMWITVFLSAITVVGVVYGGWRGWKRFKLRYKQGMNPEVDEDGA